MSVQFLEARACQRHDLGEPVFGDGVLLMIVVPRRFTPFHTWQNGGSKTKLVSVLGRRPDVHVFNLRSFPKVLFLTWKFKKMVTWKVVKQSLQSVIWAIIT